MDRRTWVLFAAGLLTALLVATVVSQFASDDPDGLEYVAEREGFAGDAEDHSLGDSPLADYGDDGVVGKAVAGLAGVLVTLGLGYGVFWLVRRAGRRTTPDSP